MGRGRHRHVVAVMVRCVLARWVQVRSGVSWQSWLGLGWFGVERRGTAGQSRLGEVGKVWTGAAVRARCGPVRLGQVGRGLARQSRYVWATRVVVWHG